MRDPLVLLFATLGLSCAVSCGGNDTVVGGVPAFGTPDASSGGSGAIDADAAAPNGGRTNGGGRGSGGRASGGASDGGTSAGGAADAGSGGADVDAGASPDGSARLDGSTLGDGSSGAGGTSALDASTPEGGLVTDAGSADGGSACTGTTDASATVPCATDRDCCASGRVCGDFTFTTPPTVACGASFPSGGSVGAACTGAFTLNPLCHTGLCPSSFGSCSALCASDADCGGPAFLCRGLTVNGSPFAFCVRSCTGDRSCRAGQECVLRASSSGEDRLEKYCRPLPAGASPPGTTTTTANDCDHGQAVIIGTDEYCSAPCDTNADCPAAVPKCQQFDFATPVTSTTVKSGLCVK